MGAQVYKYGKPGTPKFPEDFEIVKKAVLQVTDIKNNNNKYYAIELHKKGSKFRIFTHYGRTDDLETKPDAGVKECRFADDLEEANDIYADIYLQKTSKRKGYKEVSLASSKIGSQKARGTSSGEIDEKTIEKLAKKGKKSEPKTAVKKIDVSPGVQTLLKYIFSEATNTLTETVSAQITANGIETPLGVLTIGQIEQGEKVLDEIYPLLKKKKIHMDDLIHLSSVFYTSIPHRIGRTREAIASAVIDDLKDFKQKQDTLQLMKDMLNVNGEAGGNVLFTAETQSQYQSLNCDIVALDSSDKIYKEMAQYLIKSQVYKHIKVKNVFTVKRPNEWKEFASDVSNHRMLFHGSSVENWVGLLSRGILLPKVVVKLGVDRTDEGWLGSGIYFGDAADTAANYAGEGEKGTSFMAIAKVALGKVKDYYEITYGLKAPPKGYDSCHGVRDDEGESEFDDDEYVIYDGKQQRMEYLVEFTS